MTQSRKTTLPSGLPKRFLDGQRGYQQLQQFLEIPNTKAVQAVLALVAAEARVLDAAEGQRRVALGEHDVVDRHTADVERPGRCRFLGDHRGSSQCLRSSWPVCVSPSELVEVYVMSGQRLALSL